MRSTDREASLLDEAERDMGADETDTDETDETVREDDETTDRAREAEELLHGPEPEPESLTPEELEALLEPAPQAPESSLHEVTLRGRRSGARR